MRQMKLYSKLENKNLLFAERNNNNNNNKEKSTEQKIDALKERH